MKTSPGNEHIVDLMSVAAAQRRQENDLELTHHFAAAPGAQCVEGAAVDVFAHKAGRAIAQEEVNPADMIAAVVAGRVACIGTVIHAIINQRFRDWVLVDQVH